MPEGSRALLLDTNLLLLFLVGGKDPGLVTSSRRLNAFEEDDYYLGLAEKPRSIAVQLIPEPVSR